MLKLYGFSKVNAVARGHTLGMQKSPRGRIAGPGMAQSNQQERFNEPHHHRL